MAVRKIHFAEGEYYHVYNRGVDKRVIYGSRAEYMRFMVYLVAMNSEQTLRADHFFAYANRAPVDVLAYRADPLVSIGAYCLMPNHFHLLLTPLCDRGIERFMQRVGTAYTMYFNTSHKRSGSLFQGTYKAVHAHNDRYLKYLYAYIHLNPISDRHAGQKALKQALAYPYSSLQEYESDAFVICDPSKFPAYFGTDETAKSMVKWWTDFRELEASTGEAKPPR